jgi:hypothetical protein
MGEDPGLFRSRAVAMDKRKFYQKKQKKLYLDAFLRVSPEWL